MADRLAEPCGKCGGPIGAHNYWCADRLAGNETGVMNNCGSCKWWNDPWNTTHKGNVDYADDVPARSEPSLWGVCSFIGHPGRQTKVDGQWVNRERSPRAFTADGSDYLSELSTRNDFGCVEWEAKE